ncbi:copia protein [Nephila pilipes]|uniref:Copia protein n=1 Tax=Nephila pilipes TaxID=299642 RepID=A0A8X6PNE6_NEPPI|nr:copia protein [Nephila pilipes]
MDNCIANRLLSKPNKKTPFKLWTGRKPDIANIRIFGSRTFVYVHKSKRGKLDAKSIAEILIGCDQRSKSYKSTYRAIKRYSRTNKGKTPDRLGYVANENKNDPENYKKALRLSDKNKRLEAKEEEMKSIYNIHGIS